MYVATDEETFWSRRMNKRFLENIIDAIPTPSPEFGDALVNLSLAFVAGFLIAMLVFVG